MQHGKGYVERFVEHIEYEGKQSYSTFPQQPITGLTDFLKREHEEKKCRICFQEFNETQNENVRDNCHYASLYQGVAHSNCDLEYLITIVYHNLSGCDARHFIKELRKMFKKDDTEVAAEVKEKYISLNVKTDVKLAGVNNKDDHQVRKSIQIRLIGSANLWDQAQVNRLLTRMMINEEPQRVLHKSQSF